MSNDLHLHRILHAPRAVVWECWTQPELLKQWFCPRPHEVTEALIELRPGGRFDFTLKVDGHLHPYANAVLEVEPGARLVWTDLMRGGWVPVDSPFLGYSVAVTLADHAQGTEYRALARHRSPKAAARHEAMGFSEGWGACADQLDELARGLTVS
jgi:uncharacterized protein YndB with AHSA1/START domain